MSDIEIPDFDFSGFYYGSILESLIQYKRNNLPELTDENPYEPTIQLLRAFALVGHLSNVLLDACANETFLPTSRLRESVKNHLKLIGYDLAGDTPSTSTLLADLNKVIASTATLIPSGSDFRTAETVDVPAISFENTVDIEVQRTDQVYRVYGEKKEDGTISDSDASVSSSNPTYFTVSDKSWDSTIIGKKVELEHADVTGITGDYEIIGLISPTTVELSGANFLNSASGITWTLRGFTADKSAEANSVSSSAFGPFGGTPVVNDKFYISHRDVMWNRIDIDITVAATNFVGVWEYLSGEGWQNQVPDDVTSLPGTPPYTYIRLEVTSLLGSVDAGGALVRATSRKTGAYEYCISKRVSGKNVIETVGKLGQEAISTNAADYTVGALWIPLSNLVDGTVDGGAPLTQDGNITFDLPWNTIESWDGGSVNQVSAQWLRFRVITVSSPTEPQIESIKIDQGTQTLAFAITQGSTITQDPLGSGTSLANQSFLLSNINIIEATIYVWVDDQEWTKVDNFLNSTALNKHFRIETDEFGYVTIYFGDGVNGAMPGSGTDNIKVEYRIGAENNGNVGADTINENTAGIAQLSNLRNPQSATGWAAKEGATDESLAKVKITAPQSLRALYRAVAPSDLETLSLNWSASDGSKPVKRAKAIEELYGIKTIGLIVVGAYGYAISQDYLDELEEYFNGEDGVLMVNHEATATNYSAKTINVSATVYGGTQSEVESVLEEILRPDALKANGVDFEWDFGSEIPLSRIYSEIHSVVGVTKVADLKLNSLTADVDLLQYELPIAGTLSITII